MSAWQPIKTAPKREGEYLLGFCEETADAHGRRDAGVCVICWIEEDEDGPAEWQVQPFSEGLDCITEFTTVTHWMPLPKPPVAA